MAKIYERTRKTRRKIGGYKMAFEESKHPRDKNGQFTSKGSSKNATSKPTEEKKYEKVSKNQAAATPKQKVDYDEDYERSWGPANDEEIEKIEIDGDYERAWGPAPDPEEFPEDYKKYISHYKKWVKNGESWDGLDGLKEEDEEKERKQAYKLFNLPF